MNKHSNNTYLSMADKKKTNSGTIYENPQDTIKETDEPGM